MPVKNLFPIFHRLKTGAYNYVWTEKCERLLPKHYKQRCLEYMLREPKPVHWIPDTRKYTYDEYGVRQPVQNHPIHVKYPVQCNRGLWAGEGVVLCYMRNIKHPVKDRYVPRAAKLYAPLLVQRSLYSEILDTWFSVPCTNRAMDQIDDAFGLDYYILQTHERDLNSKLAMDLRRRMLITLAEKSLYPNDPEKRTKILNRYKDYMIPLEEAQWVGLSIKEALDKAEEELEVQQDKPFKEILEKQFLQDLQDGKIKLPGEEEEDEPDKRIEEKAEVMTSTSTGITSRVKGWFSREK